MKVAVEKVRIPAGSTLGYAEGIDENLRRVAFAGDHRMMRIIAEAVEAGGDVVWTDVPEYNIVWRSGSKVAR